METIDIDHEEINVEEIMRKVKENMDRKRDSNDQKETRNQLAVKASDLSADDIQQDIAYINSNWDIYNKSYEIKSHRLIIGRFLVKGRTLVNGEVRRYVDPVIFMQKNFNGSIVKILNNTTQKVQEKIIKLDNQIAQAKSEIENEIDNQIAQAKSEIENEIDNQIAQAENEIDNQIAQAKSEIEKMVEQRIKTLNEEWERKNIAPWARFYDMEITEELLSENLYHHEYFISLIKDYAAKAAEGGVPRLLEVGLGTATMSVYLSRYSYEVFGIDNDPTVINKAIETKNKLGGYVKLIQMDAFDLDLFKDKFFDVAFSQGTMEHFENEELIKLISKQLKVAKYVIFSVPSGYYPQREFGNERKMFIEDWELLLKDSGFNIINISYYRENWHIACIIGGER